MIFVTWYWVRKLISYLNFVQNTIWRPYYSYGGRQRPRKTSKQPQQKNLVSQVSYTVISANLVLIWVIRYRGVKTHFVMYLHYFSIFFNKINVSDIVEQFRTQLSHQIWSNSKNKEMPAVQFCCIYLPDLKSVKMPPLHILCYLLKTCQYFSHSS